MDKNEQTSLMHAQQVVPVHCSDSNVSKLPSCCSKPRESCQLELILFFIIDSSIAMSTFNFTMMQSVALGESNMIIDDEDFVVIDSDRFGDDGNWDYCDDVFSTTSSSPCCSVCSDLPAKVFEEIEYMDDTPVPALSTEVDKSDRNMHENTAIPMSVGISTQYETKCLETEIDIDEIGCTETSEMNDCGADHNATTGSKQSSSIISDDDEAKRDGVSTSRLSNKKRRKKMKLMKKAVAAAAAAAALSEMTRGNCSPSKECREPKMPTRVGKKLANVAVSCAHESLASYRQEMQVARKFK